MCVCVCAHVCWGVGWKEGGGGGGLELQQLFSSVLMIEFDWMLFAESFQPVIVH